MHFDNPIFLLLILVAGILRWLTKKSYDQQENQKTTRRAPTLPTRPKPISRAGAETDEERVRRFLEALGQPAGATPPPKIQPRKREVIPHLPPLPSPLPPLTTTPPPLLEKTIGEASPPLPEMPTEPRRTIIAPAIAKATSAGDSLLRSLTSGQTLREIVVLREILGPPRALQSVDGSGR